MINLNTGIMLFILLKENYILNHNFDSLCILLALYFLTFLDICISTQPLEQIYCCLTTSTDTC